MIGNSSNDNSSSCNKKAWEQQCILELKLNTLDMCQTPGTAHVRMGKDRGPLATLPDFQDPGRIREARSGNRELICGIYTTLCRERSPKVLIMNTLLVVQLCRRTRTDTGAGAISVAIVVIVVMLRAALSALPCTLASSVPLCQMLMPTRQKRSEVSYSQTQHEDHIRDYMLPWQTP